MHHIHIWDVCVLVSVMMLWNRKYQEFDLVVSSVTTKVKGVAQTNLPEFGEVVWDVVDYSGPAVQVGVQVSPSFIPGSSGGLNHPGLSFQSKNSFFVLTNVIVTKNQKQGKCPEVLCRHVSLTSS